jgi:hypothetical protein
MRDGFRISGAGGANVPLAVLAVLAISVKTGAKKWDHAMFPADREPRNTEYAENPFFSWYFAWSAVSRWSL